MRAACLIRSQPGYRREAFVAGLQANGYTVDNRDPERADALVIWNRYGYNEQMAQRFEQSGRPVLVAENGYLGRDWHGGHWYALARGSHNGAGRWPRDRGAARWRSWGLQPAPWRQAGRVALVLEQRGIGQPGVAQPPGWPQQALQRLQRAGIPARIRSHPGEQQPAVPLERDLEQASAVVTWASGGALKALMAGVPVFHGLNNWIGAKAARPFTGTIADPYMGPREPMLEELAWAQWNTAEIASGEAMNGLLQ